MKKIVLIALAAIMLMSSVVSVADTVAEYYAKYIGGPVVSGVVGNRLILICDYDVAMNASGSAENTEDIDVILADFYEDLKPYDFLVILYTKDGVGYMMAEIPVVDGVPEKIANGLMSQAFIFANMKIGN